MTDKPSEDLFPNRSLARKGELDKFPVPSLRRRELGRGLQRFEQTICQSTSCSIDGETPPELNGTLFRNGRGLSDVSERRIAHPFDGDGLICAIACSQGRSYFRDRFVRTD